jgi:hypothetical protein
MSMFLLYLFTMLDSIGWFFVVLSIVGWIAFAIITITLGCACGENDFDTKENDVDWVKYFKKCFTIFLPSVLCLNLITVLVPSTKQMAFIYIVGKMSQKKVVQDIGDKALQIPDKALEVLNIKMEEYLSSMKSEVDKKVK